MKATHSIPRASRLFLILDTMNRIYGRRHALGKPTAHLVRRVRPLSAAYLEARHNEQS